MKKTHLEVKGWKIGGAKEFLGLSAEKEPYIEIKLRLAESLRKQRLRHQMTQSDLAKAIESSQSRVAKMEVGEGSVSLDLLVRYPRQEFHPSGIQYIVPSKDSTRGEFSASRPGRGDM